METQNSIDSDFSKMVLDVIFDSLNLKHVNRESLNSETPLMEGGLNLDSVDILELIVNFEKKFGITMNDSEAYSEHFKNIGSVVDFVRLKSEGAKT